mmetsp:Transcript_20728/g.53467  ORF Transcript_20728/g.53467 Transcript_20728/m.53467 type:complete len:80 (+) Transcript_20728:3334-3573(+)
MTSDYLLPTCPVSSVRYHQAEEELQTPFLFLFFFRSFSFSLSFSPLLTSRSSSLSFSRLSAVLECLLPSTFIASLFEAL